MSINSQKKLESHYYSKSSLSHFLKIFGSQLDYFICNRPPHRRRRYRRGHRHRRNVCGGAAHGASLPPEGGGGGRGRGHTPSQRSWL